MVSRVVLALGLVGAAALATGAVVPDGLPAILPHERAVKDPVLALLVGLVASDSYGTLTQARLEEWLAAQPRRTRLPYRTVRAITRAPACEGAPGSVTIEFTAPVDHPLPYSVLGYHPGDVVASRTCVLREWSLGTMSIDRPGSSTVILEDVHLYGIEEGHLAVDVDGWLDALLGNALDDTKAAFLMLCRHESRWLGFAMGNSDDGKRRSGVLDLERDRVLIPVPARLKGVAGAMRLYGESIPTGLARHVAAPRPRVR